MHHTYQHYHFGKNLPFGFVIVITIMAIVASGFLYKNNHSIPLLNSTFYDTRLMYYSYQYDGSVVNNSAGQCDNIETCDVGLCHSNSLPETRMICIMTEQPCADENNNK